MKNDIKIGDRVTLLGLPDWLINDLPESEQTELITCIGKSAVVTEIDNYGYFWLGFGSTVEVEGTAHYSGHSFAISSEFIELTPPSGG